ncbi:AAA family ATPase [Francisella sp. XLW-1]|uniref:AAA family ATPase n=1 Tax=Francisella sp. XLW-1 TaxID=2610887 RepID=UPI00123D9866|nr:AAA family ATPase [Francisella sp. XLW-1]
MGQIIVVGSEKGGVQKSGLSQSLAVWLSMKQNMDVLLVDADPQATTWDWYQVRSEDKSLEKISCVQMSGKINIELINQSSRYDVVVVDVGGHDSKPLRSAMAVADKILIPLRPKRRDLKTLPHMSDLVEQAQSLNSKLVARIVFTQCPSLPSQVYRISEAKEVCIDFGIRPLAGITMMRNIYDDCDEGGKTVFESDDQKAIEEINEIATEFMEAR